MATYVSKLDSDGVVTQVVVLPDGLPDPIAYARRLGLEGTLVQGHGGVGYTYVDGAFVPPPIVDEGLVEGVAEGI